MKATALFLLPLLAAACATDGASDQPVGVDPAESGGSSSDGGADAPAAAIPDLRCAGTPDAGPKRSFRHFSSRLIAKTGAMHRGIDLITEAGATKQVVRGAISYSIADKALEDEDVDLFACRSNAWQKLGSVRTDGEGRFAMTLDGDARLPVGMRDLYVSVVGDRTGAKFLAYVAPAGTKLIVSDVDGTLTSSENAFTTAIVTGNPIAEQPGSPAAFTTATHRGYQLVYVTARGQQYTEKTRTWLADRGFPRGPLILSPSFLTLPGGDTIAYKEQALDSLASFDVAAGVGNRASDVTAYAHAGLAGDSIFINLPEFTSEVQAQLDAGTATAFDAYDDLRAVFASLPM